MSGGLRHSRLVLSFESEVDALIKSGKVGKEEGEVAKSTLQRCIREEMEVRGITSAASGDTSSTIKKTPRGEGEEVEGDGGLKFKLSHLEASLPRGVTFESDDCVIYELSGLEEGRK